MIKIVLDYSTSELKVFQFIFHIQFYIHDQYVLSFKHENILCLYFSH